MTSQVRWAISGSRWSGGGAVAKQVLMTSSSYFDTDMFWFYSSVNMRRGGRGLVGAERLPEKSSHSSPLMLSGIPLRTSSLVLSVRYMHTPCPYSAKWFFHACSFRNSFAWAVKQKQKNYVKQWGRLRDIDAYRYPPILLKEKRKKKFASSADLRLGYQSIRSESTFLFTVALNRRLNRLFSGHQCTYTYTHNMCNMAPLDIPLFQFRAKYIHIKKATNTTHGLFIVEFFLWMI